MNKLTTITLLILSLIGLVYSGIGLLNEDLVRIKLIGIIALLFAPFVAYYLVKTFKSQTGNPQGS